MNLLLLLCSVAAAGAFEYPKKNSRNGKKVKSLTYLLIASFTLIIFQIDRNKDLLRKFEEQSLQQKEMGQELHDVRDHLADTTQGEY